MNRETFINGITLAGHTFPGPLRVLLTHYATNNAPALVLQLPDGEPLATATVNLPETSLGGPDIVAIKDYSENDGMMNELVRHNILIPLNRFVHPGYSRMGFPLAKINMEVFQPVDYSTTTRSSTMSNEKQGSLKDALQDFTQDENVDYTDYLSDDDADELFETGSVEIEIENSDTVIRLRTVYEIVTESATTDQSDVFPTAGPDDGSDDGSDGGDK